MMFQVDLNMNVVVGHHRRDIGQRILQGACHGCRVVIATLCQAYQCQRLQLFADGAYPLSPNDQGRSVTISH